MSSFKDVQIKNCLKSIGEYLFKTNILKPNSGSWKRKDLNVLLHRFLTGGPLRGSRAVFLAPPSFAMSIFGGTPDTISRHPG